MNPHPSNPVMCESVSVQVCMPSVCVFFLYACKGAILTSEHSTMNQSVPIRSKRREREIETETEMEGDRVEEGERDGEGERIEGYTDSERERERKGVCERERERKRERERYRVKIVNSISLRPALGATGCAKGLDLNALLKSHCDSKGWCSWCP